MKLSQSQKQQDKTTPTPRSYTLYLLLMLDKAYSWMRGRLNSSWSAKGEQVNSSRMGSGREYRATMEEEIIM